MQDKTFNRTPGSVLKKEMRANKVRVKHLSLATGIRKERLKQYIKYSIELTDREYSALDKYFKYAPGYHKVMHKTVATNG